MKKFQTETVPRAPRRTHPGEILERDYLNTRGITDRALAEAIGVSPNRISEIIRGRRAISADTAVRLARYFKTNPEYWLVMQLQHDLSVTLAENDYSDVPKCA